MLDFQIRRRKAREQQARFAEALKDVLPSVGHAVDFMLVEKGNEFALSEGSEVGLDTLDKQRDAALRAIPPRAADEQIVGHCVVLCVSHRQQYSEEVAVSPRRTNL